MPLASRSLESFFNVSKLWSVAARLSGLAPVRPYTPPRFVQADLAELPPLSRDSF